MTTPPSSPTPALASDDDQPGAVLVLAGRPREVGVARRWLAGLLAGHPAADDALLALGELAANAVLHSDSGLPGGVFTVRALIAPDLVRVEVTDLGGPWLRAEPRRTAAPAADGQRGRGLAIVSALAADWGITDDDPGRTAWFAITAANGQVR